jgi:hypothetical protein
MIFSFHVGLTDSLMQLVQFFFVSVCSTFCCHRIARFIILIFVRKYNIQAVFNTNGPRYNFAIDDPNEKNYTANQMALKTLQTRVSI